MGKNDGIGYNKPYPTKGVRYKKRRRPGARHKTWGNKDVAYRSGTNFANDVVRRLRQELYGEGFVFKWITHNDKAVVIVKKESMLTKFYVPEYNYKQREAFILEVAQKLRDSFKDLDNNK